MKYWISHFNDNIQNLPALKLRTLNCKSRVHLWASNKLVVGDNRDNVSCGLDDREIVRFPAEGGNILAEAYRSGLCPIQAPIQRVTWCTFPGGKEAGAWSRSLTPASADLRNEWSDTVILPCAFMVCTETNVSYLSLSEWTGTISLYSTNQAVTVSKMHCFLWLWTSFLEYRSGERQTSKKPVKWLHPFCQPTKRLYELRLHTFRRNSSIFTSCQNLKLETIN